MILADTSVWVDHLRGRGGGLAVQLEEANVACHPFVLGEISCGRLRRREEILGLLGALPVVEVAEHDEVLAFVADNGLAGSGIGWIDAHLLASAILSGTPVWTLDRPMATAARRVGISAT